MLNDIIIFILIGLSAGFLAGLLGIGGGFILVPALLFFLPETGISNHYLTHVAVATSLATVVVTSLVSSFSHHRLDQVNWSLVRLLSPGILLGAFIAGWLADKLSSEWLVVLFSMVALAMGLRLLLSKELRPSRLVIGWLPLQGITSLIGTLSALVGIGGGSFIVPLCHFKGERIAKCVGTAAACGFPIALAGSLSFIGAGWNESLSKYNLGYIYLPAFLGIIIASSLTAPLGAYCAKRLPAAQLKQFFALFLMIMGFYILLKIFL